MKAEGKVESPPDLEAVGARVDDVAGLAAVAAEPYIVPTAALLRGE